MNGQENVVVDEDALHINLLVYNDEYPGAIRTIHEMPRCQLTAWHFL